MIETAAVTFRLAHQRGPARLDALKLALEEAAP